MLKARYFFKFLTKITTTNQETKIQKLNSVLTQLNIENATHLDDFLSDFFSSKIKEKLDIIEFFHFYLILWKHEHAFSSLWLQTFPLENYLKFFTLEKKYKFLPLLFRKKYKRKFMFYIFFCSNYFWSIDNNFSFFFNNLLNLKAFFGYVDSYKNRSKMLGRKTNFKRKFQKKNFNDY